MFRANNRKNVFVLLTSGLYIITTLVWMLDRIDNFLIGNILRKIKYVYLVVAAVYLLLSFRGKVPRRLIIPFSLLLLHTVLFGIVFTNPTVINLTKYHFREMILFIMYLFLTWFFIWNEHFLRKFVWWNYWCGVIALLWAGITHPSHFVNPLYFRYVFSSSHAYRTTFGLGHANFTGNICLFILIYSVFVLEQIRNGKRLKYIFSKKSTYIVLFADLIVGEMLFSTQSRTSILAGIIFVGFYLFIQWKNEFRLSSRSRNVLVVIGIALVGELLISGQISHIWMGAHRADNFLVNYPLFQQFNPWIGMGYIPASGFYTKAYGLGTFAVDIYYLYIFFTTGYIGSAIMLIYLVYCFLQILLIKNTNKKALGIAFLAAILLTGIGQTNMISYTLQPSVINWSIIFMLVSPELKGESYDQTEYKKKIPYNV